MIMLVVLWSFWCCFDMKLRGSLLVIVCCLVVEFCNISQKKYLLFTTGLLDRILFLSVQGLLFLLYPLLGHLTDVYLTRYRSLKLSCVILLLGICVSLVYEGFEIFENASPSSKITLHFKVHLHWQDIQADNSCTQLFLEQYLHCKGSYMSHSVYVIIFSTRTNVSCLWNESHNNHKAISGAFFRVKLFRKEISHLKN